MLSELSLIATGDRCLKVTPPPPPPTHADTAPSPSHASTCLPTGFRPLSKFDAPSRSAWTLPYIVTINEEHPFGMYVSCPEYYEGGIADDERIQWYSNRADKDVILSAMVRDEDLLIERRSVR